jgi:hypothetical protein
MTNYELLQRRPDSVAIVATVAAGTLAQATRKLYRANGLQAQQAAAQGYTVKPAPKASHATQTQGH